MRPSRSTLARAIAVAVVLAVLVVVGRLSAGGWRSASPATPTTASLLPLPPSRPTGPSPVMARLRLGQVAAVTVDGNAVWAAHGCAISRVDLHTNRVVAKVPLPPVRRGCWVVGMTGDAGALWVSLSGERLLRVDPRGNRVVATLALANLATPVVTDIGAWAVCCWSGIGTRHPSGLLVLVDPVSNHVVARVRLRGLPTAVGAGPSGVWVTGAGGPLWRVDPASGRVVATIAVPVGLGGLPGHTGPAGKVGDVLVGADAVWVSDPASAQVLRVDPADNRLVGSEPVDGRSLVAAGGAVWASNGTSLLALGGQGGQVSLAELSRQDVDEGEPPVSDLAASPGAVWVGGPQGLFRVDLSPPPDQLRRNRIGGPGLGGDGLALSRAGLSAAPRLPGTGCPAGPLRTAAQADGACR